MTAGRIMAFDYGLKRTGIAVSDEARIFSFPVETVSTPELIGWISAYAEKEKLSLFVVGKPVKADNSPSDIEPHIKGFIRRLLKSFPDIPVERIDERYTSVIATETILSGGVPKMKRRDKSLVDKISASLILQSFLDSPKTVK